MVTAQIIEAIRQGDLGTVQSYYSTHSNVDEKFHMRNGFTALHFSARFGQAQIAEYLLGLGANLEARTDRGNTPLHLACYSGKLGMIALLVSKGADVYAYNNEHKTPAQMAQNTRTMQAITRQGAERSGPRNQLVNWKVYYDALDVYPGSSEEEIRSAYTKKCLQHHNNIPKLQEVCEAFLILSNEENRRAIAKIGRSATPSSSNNHHGVTAWLENLGLSSFADAFVTQGIDDEKVLAELSEGDLADMGLNPKQQKTFRNALGRLPSKEVALRMWLEQHHLADYLDYFLTNDIDIDMLFTLNPTDLENIGITNGGVIRDIMAAIHESLDTNPPEDDLQHTIDFASSVPRLSSRRMGMPPLPVPPAAERFQSNNGSNNDYSNSSHYNNNNNNNKQRQNSNISSALTVIPDGSTSSRIQSLLVTLDQQFMDSDQRLKASESRSISASEYAQQTLASLQDQLRSEASQRQKAEHKISKLVTELEQEKRARVSAEEREQEVTKYFGRMEAMHKQKSIESSAYEARLLSKELEAETLQQQRDTEITWRQQLQQALNEKTQELSNAGARIRDLEQNVVACRETSSLIAELERRLGETEKKSNEAAEIAERKVKSLEHERSSLQMEVKSAVNGLDEKQKMIDDAEDRIQLLEAILAQLRENGDAKLKEMEHQLQEGNEQRVRGIQMQLQQSMDRERALNHQCAMLNTSISALNEELETTKGKMRQMEIETNISYTRLQEETTKEAQANEELSIVKSNLSIIEQQAESHRLRADKAEMEVATLKSRVSSAEEMNRSLKEGLERETARLSQADIRANAEEQNAATAQSRANELGMQLSHMQGQNRDLIHRLSMCEQALNAARQEIVTMKQHIDTSEKESSRHISELTQQVREINLQRSSEQQSHANEVANIRADYERKQKILVDEAVLSKADELRRKLLKRGFSLQVVEELVGAGSSGNFSTSMTTSSGLDSTRLSKDYIEIDAELTSSDDSKQSTVPMLKSVALLQSSLGASNANKSSTTTGEAEKERERQEALIMMDTYNNTTNSCNPSPAKMEAPDLEQEELEREFQKKQQIRKQRAAIVAANAASAASTPNMMTNDPGYQQMINSALVPPPPPPPLPMSASSSPNIFQQQLPTQQLQQLTPLQQQQQHQRPPSRNSFSGFGSSASSPSFSRNSSPDFGPYQPYANNNNNSTNSNNSNNNSPPALIANIPAAVAALLRPLANHGSRPSSPISKLAANSNNNNNNNNPILGSSPLRHPVPEPKMHPSPIQSARSVNLPPQLHTYHGPQYPFQQIQQIQQQQIQQQQQQQQSALMSWHSQRSSSSATPLLDAILAQGAYQSNGGNSNNSNNSNNHNNNNNNMKIPSHIVPMVARSTPDLMAARRRW